MKNEKRMLILSHQMDECKLEFSINIISVPKVFRPQRIFFICLPMFDNYSNSMCVN